MSNEKIYPKGLITFVEWAKTQSEHFKEYNGQKQLAFDIKVGDKGLYFQLDTYKGGETKTEVVKEENDLPF